jgi:guanylate kinase
VKSTVYSVVTSEHFMQMNQSRHMVPGKLFVISAPSGAGKTSLVNRTLEILGITHRLERVVTYTTRAPRLGDIHGVDYHFITVADFEIKIEAGFFIEWSLAYGNYYGSPRSHVEQLAQGRSFIMILDRAGARAVKQAYPEVILIWIHIKDREVLRDRLVARGQENAEQLVYRLALAQQEIAQEKDEKLFQHHVLNDDFESALKDLKDIILGFLGATKESK